MIQNIFWRWCGFRRFLSPWQAISPWSSEEFLWQNIFVQQDICIFLWKHINISLAIFVWRWCGFKRFLSPWQAIPLLILRGVSRLTGIPIIRKQAAVTVLPVVCLFILQTSQSQITTTGLPFVQTISWLCHDHLNLNLNLLVRFLIISSLFWKNIETSVYAYHTYIPVLEPKYLHGQKYTFLWHKLFIWHKI